MSDTPLQPHKTKILYIITKSNWGGAQRYVYDLATSLPRDQFDVIVAMGGTGGKNAESGPLKQKLNDQGISTIIVSHFMRDISLFREFFAFFDIKKIL